METHDSFPTDEEITAICGALPPPPPPSPHVLAQSRSLLQQYTQRRTGLRRRRAMPSRQPYLAGIAATAAVAAAVATAMLVPGGSRTPPIHNGAATSLPGAPARSFLLAMAVKAEHQSIGKYFCTTMVAGQRELVGTDGRLLPMLWQNGPRHIRASAPEGFAYALLRKDGGTDCVKPQIIGYHAGNWGSLGARPATPADTRAWRRAGSPTHWQHLSLRPGTPTAESFIKGGSGPFGLTSYLKVPADPAKLRALLLAHPDPGVTRRDDILKFGALTLMDAPVRPAVRAAAFKILASVPGLQMKSDVTDPEGQVVTAISYVADYEPYETYLTFIDPQTASVVGGAAIARTPVEGFAPGTVLFYSVNTSQGWTDRLPTGVQPPTGPEPSS